MEIALLVMRLLLAAVFFVGGATKLADLDGTRQAIRAFGLPSVLARPGAILLPGAELAVAVALVPTATAWLAALAALALLLAFIAAIAVNLARGRKPDCRCFGQLYSSPAGWGTLGRNAALAVGAGLAVWQGRDDAGPSAVAWLSELSTAELIAVTGWIVTLATLAVVGGLLLNLMRQNGRLLVRLEGVEERLAASGLAPAVPDPPQEQHAGLPVGTPAPNFILSGLYGEKLTLDALRAGGRPVMLLFTDPNCGPCNALLPEIGRWQREKTELTIALVSRGGIDENRAKSSEHGVANVLLQEDREVAAAYGEEGTPSAVLVDPDGTIGGALAAGADQIRALVAAAPQLPGARPLPALSAQDGNGNGAVAPTATSKVGELAPTLRRRDLDGRTVNLTGYRGSDVLVLFWNPTCGFCQQMLGDLRAWEADQREGAPKLLVVSTGDVEANRALGLRSPVLLDEGFTVGAAFGASGTPTGVLVDADGRIASEVAVGAQAVLGLAGRQGAPAAGPPRVPSVGEAAPTVRLPDIAGGTVDLVDFRGSEVLLLFWNPGCEFCDEILDELRAWEAEAADGAPKLLVISSGNLEANKGMGLSSPVLLDPSFSVGNVFGVSGTPMAVLVDAEGRIASEIAAGGPPVLELARGRAQAAAR